ncbi:hypothetical protein RclHR1_06810008 [Rhizophagus clarus]|uniref:Uncharacterized protein n=1 Tax=Rhizophagus clarus TaxID=94130 RepID=A0A2Z6SJX5_9GLOM|nr:hypothetical protein RclHR1_06810008 [Rhizophagus clarus]
MRCGKRAVKWKSDSPSNKILIGQQYNNAKRQASEITWPTWRNNVDNMGEKVWMETEAIWRWPTSWYEELRGRWCNNMVEKVE